MPEKPILNKGLDALLGDVEQPNANIVKNIPTNKIAPNRYQPRTSFNDEKLSELADSICLLYTSPSPRDRQKSRMPSSA